SAGRGPPSLPSRRSSDLAVFVNTNAAAAGGVVAALVTARLTFGKADLTMVLNGAIAGLVGITAEPLNPSPELATLIGAVAGVLRSEEHTSELQSRENLVC